MIKIQFSQEKVRVDSNSALQADAHAPLLAATTVDVYCLALSQLFAPRTTGRMTKRNCSLRELRTL